MEKTQDYISEKCENKFTIVQLFFPLSVGMQNIFMSSLNIKKCK